MFCDPEEAHGNPLGVFLEGREIAAEDRQGVAADLGFSETVFVDDAAAGTVVIHTPSTELPFAGHPLVGTAWLLAREREALPLLRPPAGDVPVRAEGERTFISGRPEWAPEFEWVELSGPGEVEALEGPPAGHDVMAVYAWEGDAAVRARVFPLRYGIAEDEATGAAALRLGDMLGRPLTIRQGRGSVIEVSPRPDGLVEVGGRVVLDEVRDYAAG